ncbi:MAG: hypothetical protein AAF570_17210, partial [Bacteroidota bacterium]
QNNSYSINMSGLTVVENPPLSSQWDINFSMNLTYNPGTGSVTVSAAITQETWPCVNPCTAGPGSRPANQAGCETNGDIVNPFVMGLENHWRPKKSYTFLEDRDYVDANLPRVREDGVHEDFNPFWQFSGGVLQSETGGNPNNAPADARWQFASEAMEFHPQGLEVESRDALLTYSAAILGYDNSLVTAIGKNARYNELAFEGFEDYVLRDANASCELYHWDFIQHDNQITEERSHSGHRSLKVDNLGLAIGTDIPPCADPQDNDPHEYNLKCEDCLPLFEPGADKYVLLGWADQSKASIIPSISVDRARIQISFGDGLGGTIGQNLLIQPKGVRIDGWQRLEYEFEIPSGAKELFVQFENLNPTDGPVYYDDIRIAPFDALVTSYVYDPHNRRLLAELDENHYATFYEYDEDGALVRVKKETQRGVHSVQEARTSLKKVNLPN